MIQATVKKSFYPEERRNVMKKRAMRTVSMGLVFLAIVVLAFSSQTVFASEPVKQQGTVDNALVTFRNFMADNQMDWLQKNLKDAKALLIIPNLLKAGFVWGGSGGNGVLVVRDEKTGEWSQPAFYSIGSVTFGWQIGGESAEVIMMIRTQKALDALYTTKFKLGGDTSIAAGPVGAGAKSAVTTDIVSFARSKGLYAGLNLEGSMLKVNDASNKAYYGQMVSPVDIIVKKTVSNPGSEALRQVLKNAVK
jgi:SH3 domain-containing YSC84-like protein 1